jgi:hypothetical protein
MAFASAPPRGRRTPNGTVAAVLLATLVATAAHAQVPERDLVVGEPVATDIAEDAPREPYRQRRARYFAFDGSAGDPVELILRSDAVDAYLHLEGPDGALLAEDDDGAGNLDARIHLVLPLGGRYRVIASTYDDTIGPLTLLLRRHRATPVAWRPLDRGRPARGRLDDADATRADGRRLDGYEFTGRVGESVALELHSDDFDPYLVLLGPTGEVVAENDDAGPDTRSSQVVVELPHPGRYRALVSGYGEAAGAYELMLREIERRPLVGADITVGDTVSGRLEDDDGIWLARDTWADAYEFEGRAGDRVDVRLRSTELDSYLLLLDATGAVLAEDDDGGGGLDSHLVARLPHDGRYRVVATSFGLDEGAYDLTLGLAPATPLSPAPLAVGAAVPGGLSADDPRSLEGIAAVDLFALPLDEGERVVVMARSTEVDLVLWVTAPTGELVGRDDDSAGGTDPLVEVDAPYPGTYLVGVSSDFASTGAYELRVESAGVRPLAALPRVELGVATEGRLSRGDERPHAARSYRDRYAFAGSAGQSLELRMRSTELDAYLRLYGPSGELLAEDDDGGGGFDSRVFAVLDEDGDYVVEATSYAPATGAYTLELDAFEAREPVWSALAVGQEATGRLDEGDPRSSRYGTLTDTWTLALEPGQRVEIAMRSPLVDPYLVVVDPNGAVIAQDDDGGGGLDALVRFTASLPGEHLILASSARYAQGEYTLEVTDAATAPRSLGGAP